MSTAIQIQQPKEIQQWKSPGQIKARIQAIQQLMSEALKKDTDYGIIPGMPKGTKPSLWKPGSEQILAMFQIAVDPVVEDLSTEDCYRFRVTTRLTNVQTGEFLGAGVGEASTDETKYKWRRTYSKPEFEATPSDRRRLKYGRYKDDRGNWVDTEEMQVRQEPADLANTILKMAKKRSQIDATLTVTGASSMFEQDLEDLPEETRQEFANQRRGKKQPPAPTGDVMCAECRAINGHLPSCPHRKPANAEPQKPVQEKIDPETTQATPDKWMVQISAVDKRERTKGDKRQEYRILTGINAANEPVTLYAWDTKLYEQLDAIKNPTNCIFAVKTSKSGDKTYYSVESILEITGQQPAESDDWEQT